MNFMKILSKKVDVYPIKKKVNTRRLVARIASGNAALQLGRLTTKEQVDLKREQLSNYCFKLS